MKVAREELIMMIAAIVAFVGAFVMMYQEIVVDLYPALSHGLESVAL